MYNNSNDNKYIKLKKTTYNMQTILYYIMKINK